jgi:hypothetical protein
MGGVIKMASMLDQILLTLRSNPEVALTRVDRPRPCQEGNAQFECVEIWLAPKKGFYNLWELNPFLSQLIPGITPSCTTEFAAHEGIFYFGSLFFREELDSSEIQPAKRTRYITMRVFPTERIARDIIKRRLADRDVITLETKLNYEQGEIW